MYNVMSCELMENEMSHFLLGCKFYEESVDVERTIWNILE
jgi:hypothetical protein